MRVKRCSGYDLSGYNPSTELGLITAFNHVSCLYEGKWWIGVVTEVNHEEDDVSVKFMHPHGPARSFHWPNTDDICWVPKAHIVCKIDIPETISGRQYNISKDDYANVTKTFLKFK